ncbi:MarR family winged helix-turn-helix transcriptional regulator [Thermoactinomyces sp. DSM 45892]|uniref:MarR family winged helix-turn-helix transcriptional regulator n=1 Tax=Thermoactinomyces sp. DSM 45892 TaxID=1882753 RepID=UPI00089946B2|nr:MarR family transcriptional regulator [Thermoactinomyces sp. DSM 45892]SDY77818.1 DNA-binding transcriptional regulator, MarR family [Thermoactinomyces sp. DSM 45892]
MKEHSITPETVNEIERLLREISVIVKRHGREILHNFPITPPQLNALLWLNEEGDLTIGDLSQKMYLACSTMTDLIDRMEKNKLVARIRDDKDRRVVRIRLLEYGTEVINEVLAARRAYLTQVLENETNESATIMRDYLQVLFDKMKD